MEKTIEFPCFVGDEVYFPDPASMSGTIESIYIGENGKITFEWASGCYGPDGYEGYDDGDFTLEDIGKTVFLTKEELEETDFWKAYMRQLEKEIL